MSRGMAENVTAEETNEWNDVVADTFFGLGLRVGVLTGFGLLAIARIAITMVMLTEISGEAPGVFVSIMAFLLIDVIGATVFTGALVWAALFARQMPEWARITLLSVSALVLVGSGALSSLFFMGAL